MGGRSARTSEQRGLEQEVYAVVVARARFVDDDRVRGFNAEAHVPSPDEVPANPESCRATPASLCDLEGVEVTYPPLAYQDAIVAVIDRILEEAKTVEKVINILTGRQVALFSDVLDACIDTNDAKLKPKC